MGWRCAIARRRLGLNQGRGRRRRKLTVYATSPQLFRRLNNNLVRAREAQSFARQILDYLRVSLACVDLRCQPAIFFSLPLNRLFQYLVAGSFLAAIEAAGMTENTLVIFVADHGLAMPRAKCTLYDAGLEVALLIRWPARIAAGRSIEALVSNVDILPTALEAAGLPVPDRVEGRSLLPLLLGVPAGRAGMTEPAGVLYDQSDHPGSSSFSSQQFEPQNLPDALVCERLHRAYRPWSP